MFQWKHVLLDADDVDCVWPGHCQVDVGHCDIAWKPKTKFMKSFQISRTLFSIFGWYGIKVHLTIKNSVSFTKLWIRYWLKRFLGNVCFTDLDRMSLWWLRCWWRQCRPSFRRPSRRWWSFRTDIPPIDTWDGRRRCNRSQRQRCCSSKVNAMT